MSLFADMLDDTKSMHQRGPMKTKNTRWQPIFFITCISLILLNGCTFKLIYNHLDWIIPWYVSDYISLDNEQDSLLEIKLKEQLTWHRATQLPAYAKALKQFRNALETGLKYDDLVMMHNTLRSFWQDLVRRVVPDLCRILSSATDAQIEELLKNIERKQKRYKEKYITPQPEALRERKYDRIKRFLEHWIGDINTTQEAIIEKWSFELLPIAGARLEYMRQNNNRLRSIMRNRADVGKISDQLRELLYFRRADWPPDFKMIANHNRELTLKTFLDIDKSLTTEQRQRFISELDDLIYLIEELAAEKND